MKIAIVVPNWNGEDYIRFCLDSLLAQSVKSTIIVVDNGSVDSSRKILKSYGNKIVCLYNPKNLGFAGGVNVGIRYALEHGVEAVALFNNDAVADRNWLKFLAGSLKKDTGIVTSLILSISKNLIDSTGDMLTIWGLPYPRGRGSNVNDNNYTKEEMVFGASGGASLYSSAMLRDIGLFDEDLFAYYEDVDISFRAQLAGWKTVYQPKAVAYHHIGATSGKIKGFTTYQTFKNLPLVLLKNVPKGLLLTIWPRFILAYVSFFLSSIPRGDFFNAIRGFGKFLRLMPKKFQERKAIQTSKRVSSDYIRSLLINNLPPNSHKLRKLRNVWWKISGKRL